MKKMKMTYTIEQIKEFCKSANRDLGSGKYKSMDVVADYAKAVIIIQELITDLEETNKQKITWVSVKDKPITTAGKYLLACGNNREYNYLFWLTDVWRCLDDGDRFHCYDYTGTERRLSGYAWFMRINPPAKPVAGDSE